VVSLISILTVSCEADPPASSKTAPPTAAATVAIEPTSKGSSRNLLMGTGEPRLPERFTPEQRLLHAVRQNDRAAIERVLEHGVSVNAKDDIGRNTLFLAVLDARDLDLVRWLHSKGAAVDDADVGGRTPLGFAAEHGNLDISRYLAEQGAEIDHRDIQQRTPLFHAALTNHRDVAAFLLDRGADVNARDQFGDTPLIVACAKGNGETAKLLLERGADAAAKDQEGRTARERAAPGTEVCEKLSQK
jgi:ankyrin repeat protein